MRKFYVDLSHNRTNTEEMHIIPNPALTAPQEYAKRLHSILTKSRNRRALLDRKPSGSREWGTKMSHGY